MISTTLFELLRDISERLGVLIKTSDLPDRTQRSKSNFNLPTQSSSHINSFSHNKNKIRYSEPVIQNQALLAARKKASSNSQQQNPQEPQIKIDTDNTSQASSMSPPSANLILNSNHESRISDNYSNYVSKTNYSCSSSSRGSIGSIHELDEVRSVIVTG